MAKGHSPKQQRVPVEWKAILHRDLKLENGEISSKRSMSYRYADESVFLGCLETFNDQSMPTPQVGLLRTVLASLNSDTDFVYQVGDFGLACFSKEERAQYPGVSRTTSLHIRSSKLIFY